MHPALSVIAFTVLSGAGFGLVTLCVLFATMNSGATLTPAETLASAGVGIAMATAGLLASTLHLANPRNAWRAFFRFRTSWLSREAVFSVLFYPGAVGWLGLVWLGGSASTWGALTFGAITAALAVATVFSTGMIYASLRTIPQWHNALVPLNYLLIALATGGLTLVTITAFTSHADNISVVLTLALLAITALSKAIYFFWIGKPRGPGLESGIGITRARAKLLESGESSRNFLSREFGYDAPALYLKRMRGLVFLLGFAAPMIALALLLHTDLALFAPLALLAALAGIFAERWLFFAEARHVVNAFYGRSPR